MKRTPRRSLIKKSYDSEKSLRELSGNDNSLSAVYTSPKRKRREAAVVDEKNVSQRDPNAFDESLRTLKADDIVDMCPKAKKDTSDMVRNIALFICMAVFCYSAYMLAERFYYYIEGEKEYGEIAEIFESDNRFVLQYLDQSVPNVSSNTVLDSLGGAEAPVIDETKVVLTDEQKLLYAKFEQLKAINKDIFGWIKIDGTKINYPVLRGTDNDHYLKFNYIGDYNPGGSIFMDYTNNKKLSKNRHTVIYGHNMRDGSMLAQLHNYDNEKLFKDGIVKIMTDEGTFTYKMFSVHVPHENVYYFRTQFTDDNDYYEFILGLQNSSKYKTDIVLKPTDRILTLSTCVNATVSSDYRFVVHAVLINKE